MKTFSEPPDRPNKPIDWISYATQLLRQAEHDGLFHFSAYAALPHPAPASHGPISDPALDGRPAAAREH